MKPTQRTFVVEFKSARRLPKSRTGSIWGDTDLKAIARQVEVQSSHLFESETGLNQSTGSTPDARVLIPAEGQVAEITPELSVGMPLESEAPAGSCLVSDPIAEAVPTEPQVDLEAATPSTRSGRKRVARASRVPSSPTTNIPRATGEAVFVSEQDLAALDAENTRLRKMLAIQLREENIQLRKMLGRF